MLIFSVAITCMAVRAGAVDYDMWGEDYTAQGLLGAVRFNNLKFNIDDSASPAQVNLATLPQFGGAWGTLPIGERFQYGLEATFLVGFRVDKLNYLYAGGGTLYVNLSTSLWLFDLAGGPYANLYLDPGRNIRLYAGGGPLMMYGNYRADKEFSDGSNDKTETESAFGVGVYTRAGIEFRIYDEGMLGFGARGTWSDLDFSDVGGRAELTGIALFATFTAGF